MTDQDDQLNQQLAQTLDQSLEQLDEHTLQQLQAIRLQAQQPQQRNRRPALAVAAGILLMIAVPWLALKHTPTPAPQLSEQNVMDSYLSVDPDMLADWEMLETIGEVPDA